MILETAFIQLNVLILLFKFITVTTVAKDRTTPYVIRGYMISKKKIEV
jgi:hypothetical protein